MVDDFIHGRLLIARSFKCYLIAAPKLPVVGSFEIDISYQQKGVRSYQMAGVAVIVGSYPLFEKTHKVKY